ncbi:MAG: hypothetical protein NT127_00970 [Sphingobacteriales bacterium]|nr:hypothetical protein [Sphingobacteriales bacterium]
MALSRIWSAFIIIAIITASVKTFFSVNDKAVFTAMVTGKSGDTIRIKTVPFLSSINEMPLDKGVQMIRVGEDKQMI